MVELITTKINNMKKLIILILILQFNPLFSQDSLIVVDYDRTSNWVKMYNTLPYLSKDERDRLSYAYGKNEGWTEKYIMELKGNESFYFIDENYVNDKYQWSDRKETYKIFRNFTTYTQSSLIETIGKTYHIEGEINPYKWKILTEIKEVNGYVCMKAETKDTTKNQTIIAWFTDQIPVPTGPELFEGLPGLILEIDINDGAIIIEAKNITKKSPTTNFTIPKKWKGKKVTQTEYSGIVDKYVKECIKNNRNPYWAIRY